ncbi:MAG: acetyl-CoA carboxylase biotin carboxyl carrier protein [Peptoniphilus harei]|uniref:Biotin carboxyl carrier protein of acetyl-CoA carboxylase n=1 Tax=Peptoniphilus genitalis TaxID=3036303 RepID=A0ABY4TME1_9FIRM|nr:MULTISPECIES: acetyl-CoA carboxylase biotin carboxyl carrier protein [Peptoniphilus]MDK7755002.1 acetyl-CoA carboxylase biotin carboxyl carrier protein [Peptoniphilus harei]MDK7760809.1 acetyl-CoA carboxylase biotin carboxyl carrier protein [Peptoniphilus harei]MDK8270599.1 acetyl-CoA carboxylase biotin carboxyl carrier protein [Peptoniphilus harei]MDK8338983.1 acetyl-CoA carboxylase biotin carboxyl carrier protein [Peptoniphilus harei]MDU7532685.1 acetyl-CoA carboxylase biotin carboxyl car
MEKYLDLTNKLISSLENSSLEILEFKMENFSLMLKKNKPIEKNLISEREVTRELDKASVKVSGFDKKEEVEANKNIKTLRTPILGVFYSSKSPDSEPFVKVGDQVKKGDTLCIIEAMKMMNELKAPYDCKVIDCLVNNEDFVEYDQEIFKLEQI